MAITNATTTGGLQGKLVADTNALFATKIGLLDAVTVTDPGTALVVQFSQTDVPAAAGTHTEGATLTPSAVTTTAVPASLVEYAKTVSLGLTTVGTPGVDKLVANFISGSIARGIDDAITNLFSDFELSQNLDSGVLTLNDIFQAGAQLTAAGYIGTKVAVLHPQAFAKLGSLTLAIDSPNQTSVDFISQGFMGNLGDIQIFQSSWVQTGSNVAQNAVYVKDAIGLAIRKPHIQMKAQEVALTLSLDIAGAAMAKAVMIDASAGVLFHSPVATS